MVSIVRRLHLKAQQLRSAWRQLNLPEEHLLIPELHHHPERAIAQLQEVIAQLQQPVLIGSSLGAITPLIWHSSTLFKALLINPAVRPHLLFEDFTAEQENLYSGERWLLTESHMKALAALEVAPPQDAQRFACGLQSGDETLDYCLAEQYYQGCSVHVEQVVTIVFSVLLNFLHYLLCRPDPSDLQSLIFLLL